MRGIDVSVHNGSIDWNRVKNDGISFAILRAGYGKLVSQKDKKFEDNYNGTRQRVSRSAHTGTAMLRLWTRRGRKQKRASPSCAASSLSTPSSSMWRRRQP